jgi:hypothetical protein
MTELTSDRETWRNIAITLGSLVVVMFVAIAISIAIG